MPQTRHAGPRPTEGGGVSGSVHGNVSTYVSYALVATTQPNRSGSQTTRQPRLTVWVQLFSSHSSDESYVYRRGGRSSCRSSASTRGRTRATPPSECRPRPVTILRSPFR
eukprot:scaffold2661_cov120-Isochrysis_galbana.AAC.3